MADSKIDDKSSEYIERAVRARRKKSDGPHRDVKKSRGAAETADAGAAYEVTIERDPKALEKKARALLRDKDLSGEQRSVLEKILGPDSKT